MRAECRTVFEGPQLPKLPAVHFGAEVRREILEAVQLRLTLSNEDEEFWWKRVEDAACTFRGEWQSTVLRRRLGREAAERAGGKSASGGQRTKAPKTIEFRALN